MKLARVLAAKFSLAFCLQAFATGIPVVDGLNVVQSTISAIEDVSQTMQMAEQYKTQLEQLQDQQINSTAPPAWLWDQADRTIGSVLEAVDAVSPMVGAGGLDEYLGGFKSLDEYSGDQMAQCFQSAGCLATHNAEVLATQDQRSQQQAMANQAALRNVMEQQKLIMHDAENLRRLQNIAQGSEGRMAAIQAGNQLMSAQANNLLQLRTILLAQQQMQAAQAQAQSENDLTAKTLNRNMLRIESKNRKIDDSKEF